MLAFFISLLVLAHSVSRVDHALTPRVEVGQSSWTSLDDVYHHLAARRELQITRLREYAARGTFPLNTDFPGELVPYFVDKLDTHCAVGELVRLDGRTDIVAGIVTANNHVRINDVTSGPLLDWIADSGLTKAECALIQPSYAKIEDYRQSQEWQDEVDRLQTHFNKVEQKLLSENERGLGKALLARVSDTLLKPDPDPAFTPAGYLKSLAGSKEPNVRIAAAYALARVSPDQATRSIRIDALTDCLADKNPVVRFWTAVALERIGSASAAGGVELHRRTLPIFLDVARNGPENLREGAFSQLARFTPESINSGVQLRIVPDVRRALVEACSDEDPKVREIAQSTLKSWRWRRIVYESDRMTRQYLAATHELESAAAEAVLLNRKVVARDMAVERFQKELADPDIRNVQVRFPMRDKAQTRNAESTEQAITVVKEFQHDIYKQYLDEFADQIASWYIQAYDPGHEGLYFIVSVLRDEQEMSSREDYIVPKSAWLQESNRNPHSWLETKHQDGTDIGFQGRAMTLHPRDELRIVLGDRAKNDLQAFEQGCDLFASLIAYYAVLLVDREVSATDDHFVWSGRFATARQYKPRFYEFGGRGWDFLTVAMTCNRTTGELTLTTEPIEYPVVQRPESELTPKWRVEELKLMGWRPLEGIDFFGDQLLPPEYHEAVKLFRTGDRKGAQQMAYIQWHRETTLPSPYLLMSILYEEAGDHQAALRYIEASTGYGQQHPRTLANVARWEASLGLDDAARKHAEAALQLWPDCPQAREVLKQLSGRDQSTDD